MLSRVVTENKNGSNAVTSRTRVDYDYTSTGIRSLSVDWNDANLNNSFATSERTGSVEYLVDSTNHTGYTQTIVETTKNAAGVATKRIVYTYGSDEISQTTYLPPSGGGAGWNAGTTLTFSHDAHTSVRMLTDAAGAIAQVFTYAAYGELIAIHNRIAQSVGTVGAQGLQAQALTSLLYNSESFDSRIGQFYLRARWYDGHRFTTLDPYFGNGSDPLSFNKYGFVHANPVMGIDPTERFIASTQISIGSMILQSVIVGMAVRSVANSIGSMVEEAILVTKATELQIDYERGFETASKRRNPAMRYFVHGTTTGSWRGIASDIQVFTDGRPLDFGFGFYTRNFDHPGYSQSSRFAILRSNHAAGRTVAFGDVVSNIVGGIPFVLVYKMSWMD